MPGPETAPPCLILTGPTGVGKTAMAVALADRHRYEMISADSMQVYRGLEIGTGQPTAAELRGHTIRVCGIIGPDESFSVKAFVDMCDAAAAEIRAEGRVPLFVGGTGMYLRALRWGLLEGDREESDEAAARAAGVRERLEGEIRDLGAPALHERLARVDPDLAARVRPTDPVRIVRGLEVFELEGRTLSSMQTQWETRRPRFAHRLIVLHAPREVMRARIDARVDAMIAAGWADEVRRLLDSGVTADAHCMKALGYREIAEHLAGGRPLAETVARIKTRTWQFARRQLTWFRREIDAEWMDVSDAPAWEPCPC